MADLAAPRVRLIRFGPFELDVRAGELRKHGIRIKLREQPVQILLMLLDHPGEVVLREEIRLRLWPNNTIVEFDHSINTAIKKIRDALGESADEPRYVETVARRGYRFLGEVEKIGEPQPEQQSEIPPVAVASDNLAGQVISHYHILERLGAGGMGVVYRAKDTKLDREVAIKVLPDALAYDPERLARFEREAKVLASLNHPNIAQIYGVEDRALVMELVEGETLKGPLPLDTALNYARQMAEALEAAHEKGITHRDLKPANVMITSAGVVKVLDFGLAAVAPGSADDSNSAALILRMAATQAGMIMGTAGYMSPEQAAGRPVDKRADIWSFGVVLWEMLTGRQLFAGETISATLADVLGGPIDFGKLPKETPRPIGDLLRRCLDRDVKTRLRDIGEARVAIGAAFERGETPSQFTKARSPFAWIAAVLVFALLLGALKFIHFHEASPERSHVKFQINPPEGELGDFKLSPDGRFLAFVTTVGSTTFKVWVRSLDDLDTRLLIDRQGLQTFAMFWSRDGEHIAFQFGDKLYKIARNGGPPVMLTDAPVQILGGVWLDSGVILFGTRNGLFLVPSSGGAPIKIDDQHAESPTWLPGRRFLYTRTNGIFAGSLDGAKPAQILADGAYPTYVSPLKPELTGYLLFVRGETLLAQFFNTEKLELQGAAIPVATHVVDRRIPNATRAGFAASASGVLVLGRRTPADVALTWLDRAGKRLQRATELFSLARNPAIRLSPNESQAIVPIAGENGTDLWIADLNRKTLSRFTFNGSLSGIWSPDGRKVLWAANDGNRYLKSADGSGQDELLFKNPTFDRGYPMDWSSDGKFVAVAGPGEKGIPGIVLVPMESARKPYPYVLSAHATYWAQISPGNRWMVYASDQSPQQQQVLVESMPAGRGRWQISTEGGDWPIWRRDGKELFYRQGTKIMAVPVHLTETSVDIGNPQPLFDVPPGTRFQVSRDGQRFLIALAPEGTFASSPLTVITDWRPGLLK